MAKRPHGIRKQDWAALQAFEEEKREAARKAQAALPIAWIDPPCRCPKWPFAHYHPPHKHWP